MNHANYIAAAYAMFGLVLAWDFFAPRWKLAQVRRAIALRVRRDAVKPGRQDAPTE